jgi:aryl-alcohol dehydrogenase-like predicted oxidoreductase
MAIASAEPRWREIGSEGRLREHTEHTGLRARLTNPSSMAAPLRSRRRPSRLEENTGADALELTADQLARLDTSPPPVGDRYADMTRISR